MHIFGWSGFSCGYMYVCVVGVMWVVGSEVVAVGLWCAGTWEWYGGFLRIRTKSFRVERDYTMVYVQT